MGDLLKHVEDQEMKKNASRKKFSCSFTCAPASLAIISDFLMHLTVPLNNL